MEFILPIAMLLTGLAVGGAGVWMLLSAKIRHAHDAAKAESAAERATLNERLQARENTLMDLRSSLTEKENENRQLHATVTGLKEKQAQLVQALDGERRQTDEKMAVLAQARTELSSAFEALASNALKSNNQAFLELAKAALEKYQEAAKGDLEKRQQAITELVAPVKVSLEKVDSKIQDLEKARAGAYEGLTQQVKSLLDTQKELRSETSNLVKALRTTDVRGRWGEIQLKRVVELAGMLEYCDFDLQQSANTEDGQLRPDLLVRLPGKKNIVVDAKTPLRGYLEALEATDDETRRARSADHARHVRNHMAALSKKSYFAQFEPAPEFVVLFLPGEVFFSAALQYDPQLIEVGVEQNVIIATPTTLIALLRAVAYGWRQERMAQSAQEISDLGRELYKRLSDMGDHLAKLGKSIESAAKAYNNAIGSLETRVFVSARKFHELGIGTDESDREPLVPIDQSPRPLQAPELRGAGSES